MSYTVRWLAEPYAVFFEVIGDFPTTEIIAFNAEINSLISGGERPVHVVSDLSRVGSFPHNLVELRKTITFLQNANIGLITIFGAPRLAAAFAQMLINLSGMKTQFVRNYSEALTHLAAKDARIKAALDSGALSHERQETL
jgi:DNA invertase Pin-like site-specific DNA recombinase